MTTPRNGWFTKLPGWGAGEQVGPGPGLQGPDYSEPRPPQPGEAPDLLPQFEGPDSLVAQKNRDRIRHGQENPGDLRLPPYLKLDAPINYNTAGGHLNLADLGTPSKGYRWLIHQLGMVSQTIVDDPDFTGVRAHFYIGLYRPGALPSPDDWAYDLLSLTETDFTLSKTWGSPALKVLENQHLFVYLTNGGLNGYGYVPFARVEQVPDGAVKLVQNA